MVHVFVDTGAFFAIESIRDEHHAAALSTWAGVELDRWGVVSTSLVIAETLTMVGTRLGVEAAFRVGTRLLGSRMIEIVRPDLSLETRALSLYRRRGDPTLSFTDAVSLHVIRSRRIEKAFTFDRHFEGCGAELLPG